LFLHFYSVHWPSFILFAHQAFSEGIRNIIQTMTEQCSKDVGFEVAMKSSIFWGITWRSPLKVNWWFGGTKAESFACCLLHTSFLLGLLFNREDGGDMLLQNISLLERTTWHYIPAGRRTLQCTKGCEKLLTRKETVFGLHAQLWHTHN
jgi:hypothetical protein